MLINDKAKERLLSDNAVSLLPIGITGVEGEFEKDDIVRIKDRQGVIIGVGKVSCNSDKAIALAGKKGGKPLVHYDYLYIE